MQLPCITAVVVTMKRPRALQRLLFSLAEQTVFPAAIIVVDNGSSLETGAVLAEHSEVVHLPSQRNLGGAGGFVHGFMHALAHGADRGRIRSDFVLPEAN